MQCWPDTRACSSRLCRWRSGSLSFAGRRRAQGAVVPERQDVILGAGLAGLTAAFTLREQGEDHWQIYERGDRVGGHARSTFLDGYTFDYGPHILFTVDAEVSTLIRDLLGDNFAAQQRQAFI